MIGRNSSIVVLTGAGISAESGIKTFRDNNGLWEDHHVEDVATPEAFARDPELVQKFYNMRRDQLLSGSVQPNAAHIALSSFESQFDGDFLLITQNVDNLHERAGSKNVLHMHGELLKVRCTSCQDIFQVDYNLSLESVCDNCKTKGSLRPHIVWFGEMPLNMDEISNRLKSATHFISIGTSSQVYPAAMFVDMVRSDCKRIELNLEITARSEAFNESVQGKASVIVPSFLERFINNQ